MLDSIIKLLIGDLEDKRAYKKLMKRVDSLPKGYRFAFHKIQHYMFSVGPPDGDMTIFTDLAMFTDLADFFETSASEGRNVLEVIGNDVGKFSDEFMRASNSGAESSRNRMNKEILEKFNIKEE
ncbi:DUF1048 domain-containing protein [Planococcus soli]|uniref:DUF1048 domain-containing protein n=1 Tax=Planococcus soli TaxID=2666072 RepID=UPI00115C87A3|nr:DUF1048 domain-containing protein [Planococcus soli]